MSWAINHHRHSLCCICLTHVSWLVYLIHDCGCCDVRGSTSIKYKMFPKMFQKFQKILVFNLRV